MLRGQQFQLQNFFGAFYSVVFYSSWKSESAWPRFTIKSKRQKKQLQNKLSNVDVFVLVFGCSPVTTCNTFLSSSTSPSFRDNTTSILSDTHITSNFCPGWLICRGHDMPIQGPLQSDSLHSAWRSSIFLKADVKDGQCLQKKNNKKKGSSPAIVSGFIPRLQLWGRRSVSSGGIF